MMELMMTDFVGRLNLDLELVDASLEAGESIERRALAGLSIGVEPVRALRDCVSLLEVLTRLKDDLGERSSLADVLERERGEYLRSIYFAQAGRGLTMAIDNLQWLAAMLRSRVAVLEWSLDEGRRVARSGVKLDRWLVTVRYEVDRSEFSCSGSLGLIERPAVPVNGYDLDLIGISLKRDAAQLVRVLAGLCVGMGLEDAVYCVRGVLMAFDELRERGCDVGTSFGEILAGRFDDFQRALVFACVGRPWLEVYMALGRVLEAVEARVELWKVNQLYGIDAGQRVSPYVSVGVPEACVFVVHQA